MNHDDCVADFNSCFNTRHTYPGACSLEYQNIKKIVIETLLQWDIKNQRSKGKVVVGTVRAFARGDKEQSRKSLNGHWQAYVEHLNNCKQTEANLALSGGSNLSVFLARTILTWARQSQLPTYLSFS